VRNDEVKGLFGIAKRHQILMTKGQVFDPKLTHFCLSGFDLTMRQIDSHKGGLRHAQGHRNQVASVATAKL
jgi:hypothetical protein